MLHAAIQQAYHVLKTGTPIERSLAKQLADVSGEETLDLISLANKVKNAYSQEMYPCSIINAKSGMCPENCRFCAQSAHHKANVEVYDLLDPEQILQEAETAYENGITHFGIVTSGFGYPTITQEFQDILSAIDVIVTRLPDMNVCLSLGVLGEEPIKALAHKKIGHYNINLQVNPSRFSDLIADTHSINAKLDTIRHLQQHGITVCCGGILGVGESMDDRIELAFALQELDVSVIPLNVLVAIPGTPLEEQPEIPVAELAKTFALFRLINPTKVIKFAAGRDTIMKDFQGLLMLAGINGFITGGYLTTRGRDVADDERFMHRLVAFRE